MKYCYATMLDSALKIFATTSMRNDEFYSNRLLYDDEIIRFLVSEGFLEQNKHGIYITYKGRIKIDEGGFVGARRRKIAVAILSVVTAIAAVASVLLQIFL